MTQPNFQTYNSSLTKKELKKDGYVRVKFKKLGFSVWHKIQETYDDTQLILVCGSCENPFLHWLVEDHVFDIIEDRDAVLCFHCFKEKYKEKIQCANA